MHVPSDIPVDGYISRIKTPKTRLSGQNMQVDLRKQNGAQPEEKPSSDFQLYQQISIHQQDTDKWASP